MTLRVPDDMPMHILLVEDNQDDAFLTQEAFMSLEPNPEFTVSGDGVEALEYLQRCVREALPLPDIILMDLNMPRMDGFGLLEHVKHDPVHRQFA